MHRTSYDTSPGYRPCAGTIEFSIKRDAKYVAITYSMMIIGIQQENIFPPSYFA